MSNKKATAKSILLTNVDRITNTAKNINVQVFDTVVDLVEDVKNNGAQMTDTTTTTLKNVQVADSLKKISKTVANINSQVLETASEVIGDVYEVTKSSIESIDLSINVNKLGATAQKVNDFAIEKVDAMVQGTLENGEKWQGVAEKAVKGSLRLAERQQDIVFDTLETVKGQLQESASRFKTFFSKN